MNELEDADSCETMLVSSRAQSHIHIKRRPYIIAVKGHKLTTKIRRKVSNVTLRPNDISLISFHSE